MRSPWQPGFGRPILDHDGSRASPEHELIDQGEALQLQNNLPSPHAHAPQFDPRALLNPKSFSKRPAAEEEVERGREDPTIAGQVSLVERLHNVHERTASPSKRVKTDEEQKKKPHSNLGPGGALDLQANSVQPNPTAGPAIDLTMSTCPQECLP